MVDKNTNRLSSFLTLYIILLLHIGSFVFCSFTTQKPSSHLTVPPTDHLAQEQRLALQIITTDSNELINANPPSTSSNQNLEKASSERNEENSPFSFDNQYKLLSSHLYGNQESEKQATDQQQQQVPKRIVINLNSLNSNASDPNAKGITKLTIGFVPTDQHPQQPGSRPQIDKQPAGKSGSGRSKVFALPTDSGKRQDAQNRAPQKENAGSDDRLGGERRSPKASLMEAVHRQGGIPALVMNSASEMYDTKQEPQMKFMLSSGMVDRQQRQRAITSSQQQQQQNRQSEQANGVPRASGSNLREEIENLSGNIDSMDEQLGDIDSVDRDNREVNQMSSPGYVQHNSPRYFQDDENLVPSRKPHSLSQEATRLLDYYDRAPSDGKLNKVMILSTVRNNHFTGGLQNQQQQQQAWQREQVNGGNNNYDYAVYTSGPSGNQLDEERNREPVNDERLVGANSFNIRIGSKRQQNNFPSSRFQVNVVGGGYGHGESASNTNANDNSNNNNDGDDNNNNRIYESPVRLEKSASEKKESMNNFVGAHRWRQHDLRAPLLVDNGPSNLLDDGEQQQRQPHLQQQQRQVTAQMDDDTESKSDDMSSGAVVIGEGSALNPKASAIDNDSMKRNSTTKQRGAPSSSTSSSNIGGGKMDERVAQLLSRLKLYTTRDHLMKVARDLQAYPTRDEVMRSKVENEIISPPSTFIEQMERLKVSLPPLMGQNQTFLSAGALKTSQTKDHSWLHDSDELEGIRNRIPAPIEYNSVDSLLTAASSSSPDSEEDNSADSQQQHSTNRRNKRRHLEEGSELLNDFKERQSRLKSLQDSSDIGHDNSDEPEGDSSGRDQLSNSKVEGSGETVEDYDNVERSAAQQRPAAASESGQTFEGDNDGTTASYEDVSATGAPDQSDGSQAYNSQASNDVNDYTTSRDLLDLFRDNARLFDADTIRRRTDDSTVSPVSKERFTSDTNELFFEQPSNDEGVSAEGSENLASSAPAKSARNDREEEEIRVLEQIIDELVAREKKEKRKNEQEEKRRH